MGVVEEAVSDHGVQGEDAAAFQSDEGPARALSLGDLAVTVSTADRVGTQ